MPKQIFGQMIPKSAVAKAPSHGMRDGRYTAPIPKKDNPFALGKKRKVKPPEQPSVAKKVL